jgi:pilus biogenesis lipoprotein CpaD
LIRLAHHLTLGLPKNLGIPAVFVVAAVLAGCGPHIAQPDYREQFPLKVELKTFAAAVHIGANGATNARDRSKVDVLVREYLRRSRSPLMISTSPGDSEAKATEQTFFVRERLVALGVRPRNILLLPGRAPVKGKDVVILSFQGYEIKVPECGVWIGEAGFNPTSLPHTNRGCAYQRNFGLMLADPGVLIKPNTLSSIDAQYTDLILNKYRAGESLVSEEKDSSSDVSN